MILAVLAAPGPGGNQGGSPNAAFFIFGGLVLLAAIVVFTINFTRRKK